jgi:hypothetical protein
LETIVFENLRAINDYHGLGYSIHYWRTRSGQEVDFVLYEKKRFHGIELKRSAQIRWNDLAALKSFREDYPAARAWCFHLGCRRFDEDGVGRGGSHALGRGAPRVAGDARRLNAKGSARRRGRTGAGLPGRLLRSRIASAGATGSRPGRRSSRRSSSGSRGH